MRYSNFFYLYLFFQIEEYSNRVANLFKNHGFRKGDSIGLMMNNRPEFICIWLGLSKVGIITAFINNNLRQKALEHSITSAKCQAVIFGDEFTDGKNIYIFTGWLLCIVNKN